MTISAATKWANNGDLIHDVHKLGYLRNTDYVLDPTFGRGLWWAAWRPANLCALVRGIDGSDFRNLPFEDDTFDAIAFDPPYCAKGGRETSGIKEMDDRYGQYDCPATPQLLQELINHGLTEMVRLVKRSANRGLHPTKPNGIILVKCMDYISSGRYFPGVYNTLKHADSLGLVIEDQLLHINDGRAQSQTHQVHARRNLSTLLVLRKV